MVMAYWDLPVSQEVIAETLLAPELQGIAGSSLARFAAERGLRAVAHKGDLEALRAHLKRGRPVIVAWRMGPGRYHDVVVTGFEDSPARVIVHDPARGHGRKLGVDEFERRWAGAGHWTLLVLPEP